MVARFIRQEATDSFPRSDFEIVAASGQIEHRTAVRTTGRSILASSLTSRYCDYIRVCADVIYIDGPVPACQAFNPFNRARYIRTDDCTARTRAKR
jgi:hypothetical protein